MRIWSKIRAILGWSKFVSAYVERDKKIMKLAVFGVGVAAHLIDFFISHISALAAACGSSPRCWYWRRPSAEAKIIESILVYAYILIYYLSANEFK